MKICYISNSAAPSRNASSLQTAKLCESLSLLGHQVTLILPNTGIPKTNYFKFYNIKSKFKIIKLKYFNKFPKGINYYLYTFFSLINSKFKTQNLFITRNFFTSLVLCFFKKKHILEIHDDLTIEGRIMKFLIKNFDILNNKSIIKIITTTNTLKLRYKKKYKVDKNKILVLHNASSLIARFKNYTKIKKKLNIGYFGSLYKSRGLDLIIKISKLDKDNNYIIYGGDNIMVNYLKEKYNYNNLRFNQYIPYSKVNKILNTIDICILPYTKKITVSGNIGDISKYTSPLKIFDYMITGKLIICSNLKVIKEVLKNNYNSVLIDDFLNIESWVMTINSIKKNNKKFNKLRLNAYNFANKFNSKWRAKSLISSISKNYS